MGSALKGVFAPFGSGSRRVLNAKHALDRIYAHGGGFHDDSGANIQRHGGVTCVEPAGHDPVCVYIMARDLSIPTSGT